MLPGGAIVHPNKAPGSLPRRSGACPRATTFAFGVLAVLIAAAALPEWVNNAWSFLLLALGFSLVIFVHELGHFAAAKWAGVRVEQFAIGFGKELVGFSRGETRYSLNVLPLGGYVKMLGQEDFVVDKSGELKVKYDPRSFTNKSVGQRMVIISAGVIMNLIFSTIAFAIVVMIGRYQAPAVVGAVAQNSPAARAGLQTGDRILRINGREVNSFAEMSSEIVLSNPDEPLELDVERDGKPLLPRPRVLPEFRTSESVRQLGIGQATNRRIAIPSIPVKDEYAPDELQRNDELYKLVINGEEKAFKDLGVFSRALIEARGAPVEIVVRRPLKPQELPEEAYLSADAEVESTEVKVRLQALWTPFSHEQGDMVTGALLGLVPRLTVFVPLEGKSFEAAGVKSGDIITRIGSNAYPSYATLKRVIEENAGKEVPIEVRRPWTANQGLSGRAVGLICTHREEWIAAARQRVADCVALAMRRAKEAGLDPADIDIVRESLIACSDATAVRRFLEDVDVHKLKPIVPRRPFTLLGKSPPPPIDALIHCVDENHIVVADVIGRIDGRPTPAAKAGIPIGAVITSVDGRPVRQWWELCEALRKAAGQSVTLAYRTADEVHQATLAVPACVSTALNLGPGTRIVRIDGKSSGTVRNVEGREEEVALPDFRAVKAILDASNGKSVEVEYVSLQGVPGKGTFAVTPDNVDPWLLRIQFANPFISQPLMECHPVSNPILAAGIGFKQAYQTTMQTVKSIEHMLFTRKVGLDKVSGPVGIFRMGTRVADSGLLNLLFFLALISANLAVLNFLPMPIVDGGLFLFLILEKIRGEPVSIKTQVATQIIGIALIATVFILVTYQDIKNWITGA